jgi:glycosyltransferase
MVKISVITAVYNNKHTVSQTLRSILSQTHTFIESIVIDGGSTDGTIDVLNNFKNKLSFISSEPDTGIYDALNKGIGYATGDIVGFLHADDIFENNFVLEDIAKIFENPIVDAVYGDLVYVNNEDASKVLRYWKSSDFNNSNLAYGWMPPHPTLYVRRSIYDKFGLFDTRYSISADYDLVLRFFGGDKLTTAYMPKVLVRMRVGGVSNRSLSTILLKTFEDFCIAKRNGVGGFLTILCKNFCKIPQFFKR